MYPGQTCQVIWQTSWCFCTGAIAGNFGLPWSAGSDQTCTGWLISAALPMHGHSIAAWPCCRSNACWQHCVYSAHKHHLYNTRTTRLSRNLGATEEALYRTREHLCTKNLLGRNMTTLSMGLPPSAERLGHPC